MQQIASCQSQLHAIHRRIAKRDFGIDNENNFTIKTILRAVQYGV